MERDDGDGDVPMAPTGGGTGAQTVGATDRSELDRRTLLASLGGGALLVGLAGCQGTDSGGTATGTPAPTDAPTPTATESPTPEGTPTEPPEPVVFSNRVSAGDFDPTTTDIRGYRERLLRDNPLDVPPSEFGLTWVVNRGRWTPRNGREFRDGMWFFRNEEYTLEAWIRPDPDSGELVIEHLAYPLVNDRPYVEESPDFGLLRAQELAMEAGQSFREQFEETLEGLSYFDPWFVDERTDPIWLGSSFAPANGQVNLSVISPSTGKILGQRSTSVNVVAGPDDWWDAGKLTIKIWLGKWPIVYGLAAASTGIGIAMAVGGLLMYLLGLLWETLSMAYENGKISKKKYTELKKRFKKRGEKIQKLKEELRKRKISEKEAKKRLREAREDLKDLEKEIKKRGGKKAEENVEDIKETREGLEKKANEEAEKHIDEPIFKD